MKSEKEIKAMIESMQLEIDNLHNEINELKHYHGGIDSENNKDILNDISILSNKIDSLQWVLS